MDFIPKTIHYCWFGRNPKPSIVLKCIESWKKHLPDYEICEWNEDNYDYKKTTFSREAYSAKKWAFVSDYARFDILNEHGGIYFDTDVELLKPIPIEMHKLNAFTGMESAGMVSPGLVFATVPNTSFLHDILESYNSSAFFVEGRPNYKTVNQFVTELLVPKGFVVENKHQQVYDISIYPSEYFCGYDQDVKEYDIRPETISVHHYAGSWANKSLKRNIQTIIKRIVGIPGYRKLLKLKRKLFGINT